MRKCKKIVHRALLSVYMWVVVLAIGAFSSNLFAQDTTGFYQQALQQIESRNYASAHLLLQSAIEEVGFKPDLVCLMVENALKNYFKKKDFQIFYLHDALENWDQKTPESEQGSGIVSLRYPQRWLKKVIELFPDYGKAYKLLGDYYDAQLSELAETTLIDQQALKKMEERIFKNYNKASQLGIDDPYVNRWLGDYFKKLNQYDTAKRYYLKNLQGEKPDYITFLRLAEIYYIEKQYTQGYNFAIKALQNLPAEEIYLRYDALQIAALCLRNLGEEKRFLEYIQQAIHLLPDKQEAYLKLLDYYDNRGDWEKMKILLTHMMMNNPYDLDGYRALEKFVVKYSDFLFGEKLLENMSVKFENSDQVMGNIYWFKGNLLSHQGMDIEAQKMWEISRNYFKKYMSEDNPFLRQIGSNASPKSSLK